MQVAKLQEVVVWKDGSVFFFRPNSEESKAKPKQLILDHFRRKDFRVSQY